MGKRLERRLWTASCLAKSKAAAGVKAFLVLPVAALYFAVVARCIGADEFVADAKEQGGLLK